ncbi:MAG: AI-2E family transporter [Ruminococcaceae bacterium]|nr:AI-2E family transporter [Oscillospiraceae bacterium]
MTTENKRNFLINIAFAAVIFVMVFFVLKFAAAYLFPFFIGVALAALTQKPASTLAKRLKVKSGTIAALMVLFIFILLVAAVFIILSRFYSFLTGSFLSLKDFLPSFSQTLLGFSQKITDFFDGLNIELFAVTRDTSVLSTFLENAIGTLIESLGSFATRVVAGLPSMLFSLSVTVVASCYIAKDYEKIKKYIKEIIPERFVNRYIELRQVALDGILKMGKGYLIMFIITFFVLALGFLILGRKNFFMLALAVSVVDVLPVLGTGTVLLPWAAAELVFGRTLPAVGLILIYVSVTVLRNILEPKIIGKQTGLHPLLCLAAMFVGLKSVGFWGLIVFPLALTVLIQLLRSGKIKI